MAKKTAVGVLVITDIPGMGEVAVLQRRGEFNHEKMGPESFPGSCQLTIWGGANQGETTLGAIIREAREEMGNQVADMIIDKAGTMGLGELLDDVMKEDSEEFKEGIGFNEQKEKGLAEITEVYKDENDKRALLSFAVKLPCEFLKKIQLGPSSGGIKLLKPEQIDQVVDLKNFDKNVGVTDRNTVAMFADTKEALKRSFALLSR